MKVAFLGPHGTFSHEFARSQWPSSEFVPIKPLSRVVEIIANSQCNRAAVPFFNDNTKNIKVAQEALYCSRDKVFVTELMAHDVRHCIYSYGALEQIREIRSIEVVFPQISSWLSRNRIRAKCVGADSTAAAVAEVNKAKDKRLAAIGSQIASEFYTSVPILERDIQNVPNQTIFAVVGNDPPQVDHFDFLLFSGRNVPAAEAFEVSSLASDRGFRIMPLDLSPLTILDVDIRHCGDSMRTNISSFIDEMHRASTKFRYIGGHFRTSLKSLIERSKNSSSSQTR